MANIKKRKLDYSSHGQFGQCVEPQFGLDFSNSCKRRRRGEIQTGTILSWPQKPQTDDAQRSSFCIGKSVPPSRKRSFREKLTKRVSRYLMKSKLKRFEDYSLHSLQKEINCTSSEPWKMMSDRLNHCKLSDGVSTQKAMINIFDRSSRDRTPWLDGSIDKTIAQYSVNESSQDSATGYSFNDASGNRQEITSDLQQTIGSELRAREESLLSMIATSNREQALDAVRRFHISNAKVAACNEKLNLQQKFKEFVNDEELTPCKAKICLSNIRIPLIWKDADYFSNKGDYRRYAVFCLIKCGHQVESTALQKNIDRTVTDLTFDDVLVFSDVDHDFLINIEIYCHELHGDLSIASTPLRLKKRLTGISGSLTRHLGKAFSGLSSADVTKNMILGPKFELVAKGSLELHDADTSITTHDLLITNTRTSCDLPLFGCYCCRLAVQPYCLLEPSVSGAFQLECQEDNIEEEPVCCELKNGNVVFSRRSGAASDGTSFLTVPITRSTKLERLFEKRNESVGNFTCLRKLLITNDKQFSLTSSSESLLIELWSRLQLSWVNQVYWKQACVQLVDLLSPSNGDEDGSGSKIPTYDEISINEL